MQLSPDQTYSYLLSSTTHAVFIIQLTIPDENTFKQEFTTYPPGLFAIHQKSSVCYSSHIQRFIVLRYSVQTVSFVSRSLCV